MSHIDLITPPIVQGETPLIEFSILDEDDEPMQPTTLTFTLYSPVDSSIVNSRDAVNVLSSCVAGVVSHRLTAADTAVVAGATIPGGDVQIRRALFRWTWGAGLVGTKEVEFGIYDNPVLSA